ncbi:MAG: SDR family NAD(P)-dependent oxidoreductase [Devosia sp.]|jgi:NAD(P)-dependent dehydrogenase (short-subunit alcohol dehydrogenase family)|uniref:SDR family NAD(P)-dependent oxidoreductase n=1 Tax=Devosia sp. TaxID=1871048 RepID=UPI001A551480|nr:SDR family NAD(P)-dependent oxidoreductase [Devosia sp.]MBL8598433.1 SDR family NAD(P)-dependent oxidoreductase [Devosia sp.]
MAGTANKGVAWVTGAGTGIGRGIARRLAEDGWTVAVSARTARDLDSLAAEVPGRITAFQLDVTDPKAADDTGRRIEADLGPVDLAVLNAGSYFPTSAESFSVDNFRKTVDLNLMGTVNCMGPIVPSMVSRRSGHIAIMGSQSAFSGLPTAASYGATKAALNSMAEAFKPDFDRFGVTITIINPGFVKTPLTAKNRFPMPFLMELDDAVEIILRGLEQRRFAINFPWQMTLSTKLLAALPGWAKFAVTRKMLPKE